MMHLVVHLFMITILRRFGCFAALMSLATFGAVAARGDSIGFFYALDADLQSLKSEAQEMGQPAKVGTRSIHRLRLGTHEVYAVRMGSGATETAVSAQALLSRFRCDWAFSLGPAGALTAAIETGRWYRVERVLAFQHGTSAAADPPDCPSWSTDWSRFPSDSPPALLRDLPSVSVASGEQFISTTAEREHLQATTQADTVDMNGFGLALVCADHNVPLFSWKIISDRADEYASETFRVFITGYSGEGGRALADIIRTLPANPNDPSSYPAIERLLRSTSSDSLAHPSSRAP